MSTNWHLHRAVTDSTYEDAIEKESACHAITDPRESAPLPLRLAYAARNFAALSEVLGLPALTGRSEIGGFRRARVAEQWEEVLLLEAFRYLGLSKTQIQAMPPLAKGCDS